MPTSPLIGREPLEYLRGLLARLNRPIELAHRQGGAKKAKIKNLETFITGQIVQALGEVVFPRKIESELLALRALFQNDTKVTLPNELNQLIQARRILDRISFSIKDIPKVEKSVELSPASQTARSCSNAREVDPSTSQGHRPLHEVSIRYAKGVGPKRALLLEKLGIRTIEDALWVLPWRYEDRSVISSIFTLVAGERATVSGVVDRTTLRRIPRRNMTLVSVFVRDETGVIEVVFFNQPYLEKTFQSGMRVVLSGLVSVAPGRRAHWQMRSPQFEVVDPEEDGLLHVGRIVPVYHETKGLTSRHLRRMMQGLLEEYHYQFQEILPLSLRQRYQWPTMSEAMRLVHFPEEHIDLNELNGWQTPAHRRLAFEECFVLQVALAIRQMTNQKETPGIAFTPATPLVAQLHKQLPFPLTKAQTRVIHEIQQDMVKPSPMNRLIQGDVGSGKTIVALNAMLIAVGSGYQAALMVPTEILAEQHYLNLQKYVADLGVKMARVSGGLSTKEREKVYEQITSGEVQLIVGTHALLEETVQFAKLGLVVVDEQHKFGVLQRGTLRTKGIHPDVIVMTATPIPRTLAMTVYGDLDVSVIDEMPPGRKPIQTRVFRQSSRSRAYSLIRKQIESGRQAYIVYPLVEESEKTDLEAATQAAARLQKEEFPFYTIGLLHGRMKSEEKAQVMAAFKEGFLQVLVATTVIEVGLDIPNATVMAIEHADRFGLAQLHQLRGRVGRGDHQSFCLLISSARSKAGAMEPDTTEEFSQRKDVKFAPELPLGIQETWAARNTASVTQSAQQRLKAMVNCSDGFAIAEQDLLIRGPGEFLGTRQWGIPEFRVADLVRDSQLLEQARDEAFLLVQQDPHLSLPEHQELKTAMLRRWQKKLELGSIG
ncbi:ATP-dependent DNA helicase RecG [Candidatus Nitronereus thalassa]|uniref:ATP-dependent DNA helicase RecG n=1 Tax=Candidatus Nitronereus thalassa TaxID=3020898 RepID=A0ABU3K8B7_9BACT|nr:ATP-dependent DNA helicase RecG [Candidatus Nitronereus thalassa]MDT7042633.1 ATP-dependent DNA helicase RecG [Candidatus Nitronereus thalassa]